MLRLLDDLVRLLRRHSPGARSRCAYRLLQTIVIPAEPRVAPVRREATRRPGRRF